MLNTDDKPAPPHSRSACFTSAQVHQSRPTHKQPQPACRCANLSDFTDATYPSFILRMIFGSVERTRYAWRAAVDWGIRSGTNIKLGKRVEINVDLILRRSLRLGFDLAGLQVGVSNICQDVLLSLTCSRSLGEPPLASIRLAKLRADDRFLLAKASFMAAISANCRCETSSFGIVK